ncbi:MAG: DUF4040 domain-containing protein [Candidatus Porifericomitaceae bacterium WSBS_2022_MAG_OTU9]
MDNLPLLYHTVLPLLMVVLALSACLVRELFAAVTLMGIFSMLTVLLFVSMQALDVALTEAVVGTGVATILFLCCLSRTVGVAACHGRRRSRSRSGLALVTCVLCAALLCYGTIDMPGFGTAGAYVHNHVNPYYLEATVEQMGIINVVTAVLAAWRGYDTFGELVVVFAAGVACLIIMGKDAAANGSEQNR